MCAACRNAHIPVTVVFLLQSVNILRSSKKIPKNVIILTDMIKNVYILYPYYANYEIAVHAFNLH